MIKFTMENKCLICCSELESLGSNTKPSQNQPQCSNEKTEIIEGQPLPPSSLSRSFGGGTLTLSKQLDAFFTLKNVFELTSKEIRKYFLECNGNLYGGTWARLCAPCKGEIGQLRKIYSALQILDRKYKETKWIVHEKVRRSKKLRLDLPSEEVKSKSSGSDYLQTTAEAGIDLRQKIVGLTIKNGKKKKPLNLIKPSPPIRNPFSEGDRRASELALLLEPELSEDGSTETEKLACKKEEPQDKNEDVDVIEIDMEDDAEPEHELEVEVPIVVPSVMPPPAELMSDPLSLDDDIYPCNEPSPPATVSEDEGDALRPIFNFVETLQEKEKRQGFAAPVAQEEELLSSDDFEVESIPSPVPSPEPMQRKSKRKITKREAFKFNRPEKKTRTSLEPVSIPPEVKVVLNESSSSILPQNSKPEDIFPCPFCNSPRVNLSQLGETYRHLMSCTLLRKSSLAIGEDIPSKLLCPFCENLSFSGEALREYCEHLVMCKLNMGDGDNSKVQMTSEAPSQTLPVSVPLCHRLYICSVCENTDYIDFDEFLAHLYTFHQGRHRCRLCLKRFTDAEVTQKKVKNHFTSRHSNMSQEIKPEDRPNIVGLQMPSVPWLCPSLRCSQEFTEENLRDLHVSECHLAKNIVRAFNCVTCTRSYFSKDEITLHLAIEHTHLFIAKAKTPFQCKECLIYLPTNKLLLIHKDREHGKKARTKCYKCKAIYASTKSLKRHMETMHKKWKPKKIKTKPKKVMEFHCGICHKAFQVEAELSQHLEAEHALLEPSEAEETTIPVSEEIKEEVITNPDTESTPPIPAPAQAPKPKGCSKAKVYSLLKLFKSRFGSQRKKTLPNISSTPVVTKTKAKGPPYNCLLCDSIFQVKYNLTKHQLSVHKIEGLVLGKTLGKCLICGVHFQEKAELLEHLCEKKQAESEKAKLNCVICKIKFKTEIDIRTHIKFKHPELHQESPEGEEISEQDKDKELECSKSKQRVKCPKCEKTFHKKPAMITHYRIKHEKNYYKCVVCDTYHYNKGRLHVHKAQNHGIDTERYKCKTCGKMNWFFSKKARDKCCQVEPGPLSVCEICGKQFDCNGKKAIHKRVVHERAWDQVCEVCGKRVIGKSHFIKHMAEVHNIGDFKCSEEGCEKVFGSKTFLERHVRFRHLGEERPRKFLCTLCGTAFFKQNALTEHMNAVHINKETKPFQCDQCGMRFSSRSRVKGHWDRVHGKGRRRKRAVSNLQNKQ